MCLTLNSDYQKETLKYQKKKSRFRVWKLVVYVENLDPRLKDILQPHFRSPWSKIMLQQGMNDSGRTNNELSDQEKKKFKVLFGLHFFTAKKSAINLLGRMMVNTKKQTIFQPAEKLTGCIIPVWINPKDVVAVGEFDNEKSLVATKGDYRLDEAIAVKIQEINRGWGSPSHWYIPKKFTPHQTKKIETEKEFTTIGSLEAVTT